MTAKEKDNSRIKKTKSNKKSNDNIKSKQQNKKSSGKSKNSASTNKSNAAKKNNKKNYSKNQKNVKNTSHKKVNPKNRTVKVPAQPIKIGFLGGLNEVGKNMTVYEYNNEIIIVDCGLSFPDQDMLGVDLVIPDFTYIENNIDRVKGVFVTHGHEDHIGGLPFLLKNCNIPIYSTKLTIGLIGSKLKEHKLYDKAKLNVMSPGDSITLGSFTVEMIHVNHSIPDAVALAIKTDSGTIIQTGDFKIDNTPIDGEVIDLNRFAQLGSEGVLCMLSDSTNAERPGYTESERKVGESFEKLFRQAGNRRIIIATFASNIHRVQQIIDVAYSLNRKVALSGRSLENVISIGSELGYLKVPEGVLINIDQVKEYTDDQMVIITTGSQGEPLSALARMSLGEHKKISISANDYIIISAQPIPGNEKMVSKLVNDLMGYGAEVVYEKMYDVHVSGHACQEELKLIMGLIKPKYFIPVHGERKHLTKHAMTAQSMGISKDRILIAQNGFTVNVSDDIFDFGEQITAGQVFVDGTGVGDVGNVVLGDRKRLSQEGIIVVAAAVDKHYGELVSDIEVTSRGFVYVKESEYLIEEAKKHAENTIYKCFDNNIYDINAIKSKVRDDISRLMYTETMRSPTILVVLMEV